MAIKAKPKCYRFINKSVQITEKVKLKAVELDAENIMYMHLPSEAIQLAALKQNFRTARKYIYTPSGKVLEYIKMKEDEEKIN